MFKVHDPLHSLRDSTQILGPENEHSTDEGDDISYKGIQIF